MRVYETGATRDDLENKPQYVRFMSPLAVREFGEYMLRHQVQADGSLRAADNWKRGIPKDDYLDSLFRHVLDVWLIMQGFPKQARGDIREALCGVLFNAQGLLHELLKEVENG